MKHLIFTIMILFSANSFAKRCVEYFNIGEDAYLAAVDFNKIANSEMKEGNGLARQGYYGAACGHYEVGITHYNGALELISEAVFEMMGASRNCFWRRDRNRAQDNLDLLRNSASGVKGNIDKEMLLYEKYCQ